MEKEKDIQVSMEEADGEEEEEDLDYEGWDDDDFSDSGSLEAELDCRLLFPTSAPPPPPVAEMQDLLEEFGKSTWILCRQHKQQGNKRKFAISDYALFVKRVRTKTEC